MELMGMLRSRKLRVLCRHVHVNFSMFKSWYLVFHRLDHVLVCVCSGACSCRASNETTRECFAAPALVIDFTCPSGR